MAVNTVTQYLGLNVRTGVTPQLRRIRGVGTVATVGPTFGSLDVGGGVSDQPINRAVFFNGSIISTVGSGIYRSTDGGLSWSLVFTLTSISAANAYKSGLNVVCVDNNIYLCLIYSDTGANPRGAYSSDGINWATNGPLASPNYSAAYTNDTVWGGRLWALCASGTSTVGVVSYQPGPAGFLFEAGSPGGTVGARSALGVFNNKLYMTSWNGTTRPVYVITNNVNTLTSLGTFTGGVNNEYKPSFLVEDPYLYVFALKDIGSTWGCWQIDASDNVVDVTASVIPAGMTGAGPAAASSRTLTFADTDWAPGTNPPKYLIHANNGTAGTAVSLYAWQGPSSPMILLDSGGDVATAFSISKFPTASGFFIVGRPVCVIQMVAPITSGVGLKISFIIQAPAGSALQNVRLWYGTKTDEYLQRLGSLSNPSVGVINSAGTVVEGLPADNVTVYYFTWTPPSSILGTNGVGDRYKFSLEAFQ